MKAFRGTLASVVLVLALGTVAFTADLKVRVVAPQVNIRLKPDLQSAIISKVPLGGVLDVMQKEGDWYQIKLPPDEKGIVITGYIHQSTVEVVEETKEIARIEAIKEKGVTIDQPSQVSQAERQKKYTFRAGLGFSFPSGDMSEFFGLGIGLSAGNSISLVRQPTFDIDLMGSAEAHIFFREEGYFTDVSWTRFLLSGCSRIILKLTQLRFLPKGALESILMS